MIVSSEQKREKLCERKRSRAKGQEAKRGSKRCELRLIWGLRGGAHQHVASIKLFLSY